VTDPILVMKYQAATPRAPQVRRPARRRHNGPRRGAGRPRRPRRTGEFVRRTAASLCCLNEAPCPPLARHGDSISRPLGGSRRRAYVPKPRSGNWAVLVALAEVTLGCLNEAPCPPFTSHGAPILLQ
jgi:hypothetical protein